MAGISEHDPEELFKLYFEYDGNIHALLTDPRCEIKTYKGLHSFCDRNDFKDRLNKIRQKAKEQTNEELSSQLVIKRKEIIAICRGIFAKYATQLTDKEGEMKVSAFDLNTAYKIFKTEMGEATEISRHEFSSVLKGENIFKHFLKRAKEEEEKERGQGG